MKLLIKETVRIIRSNLSSTFFIIILQSIAAITLFAALIWALNFSSLKIRMQSKFEAKVFLKQDVPSGKIKEFKKILIGSEKIYKINFVSRKDAKKIFVSRFSEIDKNVVNQVEFPASFNIRFKSSVGYDEILNFLKNIEKRAEVESVVFPHKLVYSISRYFSVITFILIGLLIIIFVGIQFVIKHLLNKFALNEKEKLKIKYLIGAKKNTIILPYYFSSILLCFVSTIIGLVLVNLFFNGLNRIITINLLENKILFSNIIILFLSLYVGYVVAPKNLHFK